METQIYNTTSSIHGLFPVVKSTVKKLFKLIFISMSINACRLHFEIDKGSMDRRRLKTAEISFEESKSISMYIPLHLFQT